MCIHRHLVVSNQYVVMQTTTRLEFESISCGLTTINNKSKGMMPGFPSVKPLFSLNNTWFRVSQDLFPEMHVLSFHMSVPV
jgi:hypothetical protein